MKSTCYTFLVFLLLGTYSIEAQTWDWISHTGSTGQESNPLIRFDNQGSIFITGNYGGDFSLSDQDLSFTEWTANFIAKYQLDGELMWVKSYNNHKSTCNAIDTDQDGNLYVASNWNGPSIDIDGTVLTADATHGKSYLAKYDNDGNLLWAKNEFDGIQIENIAVDNNGNVSFAGSYYYPSGLYFGGNTYEYDNTQGSNLPDGVVGKFDANGDALWVHTFNGPDRDDVSAIGTDADNNVYITGRFNSDVLSIDNSATVLNKENPTSDGYDLFVIKYDPLGNQEWIKVEGGDDTVAENPPYLTVDDLGNATVISDFRLDNLLIDGTINVVGKDWCTTTLVAQFDKDGLLKMATSALGNQRIIGTDIASYNGKLYLTGSFGSEFSSTGTTLVTNGGFDAYIAEIDGQGNWNWALGFGGDYVDRPSKLALDNDGNLFLVATTNSTNLNVNNTTYPGIGEYDYLFGKIDLGLTSNASDLTKAQIAISALPNPTSDNVLIDLGDKEVSGFLDVVNTSGALLDRLYFSKRANLELDLSTYSQGVYFVKVNSIEGMGIVKVIKN